MQVISTIPLAQRKNYIVTVLGRKGSGKSTLVKKLIEREERLVIIDTLGEYGEEMGLRETYTLQKSIQAIKKGYSRKAFGVSVRLIDNDDILTVIEYCFALGEMTIVIEEASMLCKPTTLPGPIAYSLRYGRHKCLNQVYIARRPAELNREVTAQSDVLITFEQKEPRDIEYLRATLGAEAEQVSRMERYHYLYYGDAKLFPKIALDRFARQV